MARSTIGDIISRIRTQVKAVRQDALMTDRVIYTFVLKHAKWLMKREDSKNKLMGFSGVAQTLDFVEEAQTGDLAFFDNEEGKIVHVGILINNQQIIHASGFVRIDKFLNSRLEPHSGYHRYWYLGHPAYGARFYPLASCLLCRQHYAPPFHRLQPKYAALSYLKEHPRYKDVLFLRAI